MSIGDFTTKKNAANAEERELNAQANKDEADSNVRSMKDLVGSQLTILGNGIGHFHKAIEAGLESDLNAGAFDEGAKKLTPLESLDQTSS